MSRWPWLKDRTQRLKFGTLEQLYADLDYCRWRENLSTLKSHLKSWEKRRLEVEKVIVERFGEEALGNHCKSCQARSN